MSTTPFGDPVPIASVRHHTPATQLHAGSRALEALLKELDKSEASSVVLVSSNAMQRHEQVMNRVSDLLGDRLRARFPTVERHSPVRVVEELRDLLVKVGPDAVVVVGGGSAIVTSRAASILAGEGRPLAELSTFRDDRGRVRNPAMPAPKLPQWVIPSTPTTAYAKAGSALRQLDGHRVAVYDAKVRARGVFIDGDVIGTAPASLVVSSSLNAVSMAVEGLLATAADPLAEALLSQGLRELNAYLPRISDDGSDLQFRSRLTMGAFLAGQGSDFSGGGLALALAHTLGLGATVPQALLEAVCLPHTFAFVAEAVPDRIEVVAEALGLRESTADAVMDALHRLLVAVGVPTRLKDLGVEEPQLPEVAAYAARDWAITTRLPRVADTQQFLDILERSW